ncbi:hypothetical protein [Nannocystis sp.]|uniref:hypothetical protein n=1 Tax=Nannocystis sp. TaxID=1962667 RepID=UPI0025E831AC|nr:hypothetical protein [Nannocystis sp.]MBK7824872.1 hypothetical protein [Nannocystis sp.]
MSISEIADNKWEVQAAKPPVSTVPAIFQILLIASFAAVFVWILQFSVIGIFGAKRDTMADNYGKMGSEAAAKKE